MKRKRSLEIAEASVETVHSKKQRSPNKINASFMSIGGHKETADLKLQSVYQNTRRKNAKAVSPNRVIGSEGPGSSAPTEKSNKRGRKPKADISANGGTGENLLPSVLKKRKKNGFQMRAASDSPSDFQPLKQFIKKESPTETVKKTNMGAEQDLVIDCNLATSTPAKKRRGKKASFNFSLDVIEHNTQPNTPQKKDTDHKGTPLRHGVLKSSNKNKQQDSIEETEDIPNQDTDTTDLTPRKAKKKVRIDETESLKVKKELAEPHFSAKELPAKIIKSKSNKSFTEEVKVSPLTIATSKKQRRVTKNSKLLGEPKEELADEDDKSIHDDDITPNDEHEENGIDHDLNMTSEESDLEVYYINKNAEKEARKKSLKKHSILMPKEDQLILVQRLQEFIPEGDTKNYKYRLQHLEWQKIAFKDYSLEDCQKVWSQLLKKVRHYRLLIEITQDIKNVIELNDLPESSPKKRKTSKKHPDMPKRPLTSYFLYYIRKRDKICKERPDLDTTELNKCISEKYQNLPLEKKHKYESLAAKNREEYKKQLEEFYEKHPEMRKVVIKKERKERKEKPPKRPENPYRLFVRSELDREEIAEEDKAEFKEVCREKWRQMPDSKKLGWINLAEEHHMKFEEDLKEYMARHPEYTPKAQLHKPLLSRQEMNLKEKLAGKPKKPPGTAYGLFISMSLQGSEIADIPAKERWNYTSTKWKAMTDEEREQYKQLLAQVQEQYQIDFKAYLDSLPENKRQDEILKSLPKKRKNAAADKPSTSTKPKATPTKSQPPRVKNTPVKVKVENPIPPPRSAYKVFAETFAGEDPKGSWKKLSSEEKEQYEEKLKNMKDQYIKDFEKFLKSLTKDELTTFVANRNSQEEYSSSDASDSESEHGEEESSEENSDTSENENESEED